MLYKLAAVTAIALFIGGCAENVGDHADPMTIFFGQLAQGSVGSNDDAQTSSKTPSKRSLTAPNPYQTTSKFPPKTTPQSAVVTPMAFAPTPTFSGRPPTPPVNTPW